MDGGTITAPNFAIWTPEQDAVENVGVAPDIGWRCHWRR
jgi:hypothetical protein